jgi:hypothetical protein
VVSELIFILNSARLLPAVSSTTPTPRETAEALSGTAV